MSAGNTATNKPDAQASSEALEATENTGLDTQPQSDVSSTNNSSATSFAGVSRLAVNTVPEGQLQEDTTLTRFDLNQMEGQLDTVASQPGAMNPSKAPAVAEDAMDQVHW